MPENANTADSTNGEALPFATTETRRIVPDDVQPFRSLHYGPGEAHVQRTELLPEGTEPPADSGHQVLGLVHFTDFQLADLASPARLEFLQKHDGEPERKGMTPSYRPQEFLQYHAIEGMVRTINALVAAQPGTFNFALTTGDNADPAQFNEVQAYLRSLNGGEVQPAAGTRDFQDAPTGLGLSEYYNPEPNSGDRYQTEQGFPAAPGALAAAAQPFHTEGLGLPWLTCFGNHDCLMQGRPSLRPEYDDLLTGDAKPVELNEASVPADAKTPTHVEDPSWTTQGPTHEIEASQDRSACSKENYVRTHLEAAGTPAGHGFTAENLEQGTTYYAYNPNDEVRLLVLDTTNTAGHVDGCIDDAQFQWMREQLEQATAEDRLVVLASHHGLSTLNNDYGAGDERGALHLAGEVEGVLHEFSHVVLWLSGHTHINKVTPRPETSPKPGSGRSPRRRSLSGRCRFAACRSSEVKTLQLSDLR